MFEKTLVDVVKGIRACKRDTALYISQCIAETKAEINSTDIHVKANALQKITFLQMMGYQMNWANFTAIEVMSSPRFAHKRIGYLAACQGFHQDTDVILLTTNLLQKELRGAVNSSAGAMNMSGVYEAGLAINCVSNIVTEDLARDLLPEVTQLMTHAQPYLRKKTVLCLFKLFVKYPQALRLTFDKLQLCLDDSNASVVSCAVNVVTELSDKNPTNYLHLAPAFFQLLTSSSNNWMLIKVVKLLGSLVPEEPRLARKLLEPLAHIVESTQAKSLLYEACHAITLCLPYCRKKSDGSMPACVPQIVTLCAETLKSFLSEDDQNLKYLGLVGFAQLMQSHPKVLVAKDYQPLILQCLSDDDITIRTRALDLLKGMTSPRNLQELITQLLKHVDLASGVYKNQLVLKIIELCHQDKYTNVQDFAWYIDILILLGHRRGISSDNASYLQSQLTDVTLRVLPVRTYAVRRCMEIVMEEDYRTTQGSIHSSSTDNLKGLLPSQEQQQSPPHDNGYGKHIMVELLPSVAWIVGEYSDLVRDATELEFDDDDDDDHAPLQLPRGIYHSLIHAMLAPTTIMNQLCTTTQSIYVQAAMKIFAAATADSQCQDTELETCVDTLTRYIPVYMESPSVEVKERAHTLVGLLQVLNITTAAGRNGTTMPALTSVHLEEEDSSSSEEEEEKQDEMDLLALGGITTTTSKTSKPNKTTTKKSSSSSSSSSNPMSSSTLVASSSIASKCRAGSSVLQQLLKPEPMKPISAKAQTKKRRHPLGVSVSVVDTPVDMSVFHQMFASEEEEQTYLTMESVSFTQQRIIRSHVPDRSGISSSTTNAGMMGSTSGAGAGDDVSSLGSGAVSFQHHHGSSAGAGANGGVKDAQQDMFYLPSSSNGAAGTGLSSAQDESQGPSNNDPSSKFGSIHLVGDDEDDDDKKKKKKKDKRRKKKKGSKLQTPFTVYNSDDDDDDDEDDTSTLPSMKSHTRNNDNPFAALSKVDLTTPLGAHEVMPKREHRVVPDRPPMPTAAAGGPESVTAASAGTKKKKKKKDSKKKQKESSLKKSKSSKQQDTTTTSTLPTAGIPGMEGDLLGFGGGVGGGGFAAQPSATAAPAAQPSLESFIPSSSTIPAPSTASGGGADAISSAFGDLLSLGAPAPPQQPPVAAAAAAMTSTTLPDMAGLSLSSPLPPTATSSGSKQSSKKTWMKTTLKTSNASGGGSFRDWDNVLISTRASIEKNQAAMASIKIRVVNNSNIPLSNVLLQFKGSIPNVEIGTVNPSSSVESSKVGPFSLEKNKSTDLKGALCVAGDSSVPFKMTLPSTLWLSPVGGLTLDDILTQLASSSWASHSVTLPLEGGIAPKKVKPLLCSFFQAAEVTGGDDLTGTFAATCTQNGAQVRILVKVSTSSAKVDVKCTDKDLGKALISSLKKVVL